jgi:2-dehydro-3-deoxy-D-gluconate 5-dehydrogenase
LAAAGAAIVVTGRRAEKNLEAARAMKAFNVNAAALEVDVCKEESCHAMVEGTVERFGRIDILMNNAGIAIRKQPEAYTLAEWNKVIDTNLTDAFLCAHAAYPHMKNGGGGKIVNIGSMLSIFGTSFAAACGEQGWHRSDDQGACLHLGERQHPSQRDLARLDRYAIDARGAQGSFWPQ